MSTRTILDRLFASGGDTNERLLWLLDNMIWPIVLVGFIIFSFLLPGVFSSISNITFMMYASAGLGALVLAESLCLLSGNFDLSISSIAGFSAMFTAMFMTEWFPGSSGILGVVMVLAIGGLFGFINGVSIGYYGINPFLQTLALFIILRGAVFVLTTLTIAPLPESYLFIGGARLHELPLIGDLLALGLLGEIPLAVPLIVVLFGIAWYVMNYTRFGLAILAVGGNRSGAQEAGIPTSRVILYVFTISGILSGLSGLLISGYLSAAPPSLAQGDLFPAFAAAVIGGISLFGGRGDIENAFGGLLLLTMIQVGLIQIQVEPEAIQFVNGLVLLFAIYLYNLESNIRSRLISY